MVNKFKGIFEKHKYAIFIFVFFVVYNFTIVGNFSFPKISYLCYIFHLVDFSIGFLPELLPGAIYNALFSTTEIEAVNLYVNITYHLFLLVVSFMLEKFLYKFDSKNRFIAFLIVLFFITGPSTFSIHTAEIGMLDMYWLFFAVIFLIMVQNKYLKWFVPIIFALSVVVHFGAMISFIPFFALIVLFEASQNEKVSKSYILIFSGSVLISVATFIYFIANEESNLIMSLDSFRALISERYTPRVEYTPDYYEFALYRILPENYGVETEGFAATNDSSFLLQTFGAFLRQVSLNLNVFPKIEKIYFVDFARNVFASMPIIIFLYKCILSFFKKDRENKLRRFVWFCALCLLPFTFLTSVVCSVDLNKWFGHGVICLFTLVIYGLYKSPDNDYLEKLNNRFKNSSYYVIIIYFVFYMMCTVETYT